MLWQLIVIVNALIWLFHGQWKKRRLFNLSKQVKSDLRSFPFVGHAYMFLGDGENRMKGLQYFGREAVQRGGITEIWLGGKYFVVIADPVALEFVMKTCLEKDDVIQFARNLTGNGTIFAPVPIWRPRRKVLAPTFSPKNLNHFASVFSRQSSVMVNQLRAVAGTGTFSLWKYISNYTMDSVCETTLGVQVDGQKYDKQPFLKAFEECSHLIAVRILLPWLHPNFVYKMLPYQKTFIKCKQFMCDFIDQVIKSKRETMKMEERNKTYQLAKPDGLKTFLELIMESSGREGGFSDLELQEEMLVIVVAGTDTSAVGASFTALMLSRNLDIQDKVYQELLEVFGDSNRPIEAEDLPRLKYLDAVIRETLRLYPPVPVVVRKVEKELTLPSGLTLVENCGVLVHIWAVNRNPMYWGEDAENFRPERFIDTPLKHPAAFLSFSHGPRSCIGYQYAMMSMKTAVAALLRQYRVLPATPLYDCARAVRTPNCARASTVHFTTTDSKDKPLRVSFDIMMKDVDKFSLQLEARLGDDKREESLKARKPES